MTPIDLLLFIGGAFLDDFADKNPYFTDPVNPENLFEILFCPVLDVNDRIPNRVLRPEGYLKVSKLS